VSQLCLNDVFVDQEHEIKFLMSPYHTSVPECITALKELDAELNDILENGEFTLLDLEEDSEEDLETV